MIFVYRINFAVSLQHYCAHISRNILRNFGNDNEKLAQLTLLTRIQRTLVSRHITLALYNKTDPVLTYVIRLDESVVERKEIQMNFCVCVQMFLVRKQQNYSTIDALCVCLIWFTWFGATTKEIDCTVYTVSLTISGYMN